MTKFEEEFKALTSWDWINIDLIQQILTRFGNWHSDEEFQELFDKYSNLNDNYEKEVIKSSKLESQIIGLKSQLQQQALPVVKDFVAEWYEEHKDDLDFSIFEACVNLHDDCSSDFEKWFGNSENKSIETLVRMKDGYQVEKPQLFYLKNKLTIMYLYKKALGGYGEDPSSSIKYLTDDFKFTQQEIDSMKTGSYEQIEVAE